jgi:2-dehydro-3-deoxyphosphogluconate aldolase/(4S)-4-hydroxy-2-oxoglutarate aldolase
MLSKQSILNRITDIGAIAIVRAETPEIAIKIAEACVKGGLPLIEVTFTVPNATLVFNALTKTFSETDLVVGAGTVLDSETARIAILAGAKFIVGPNFDQSIASLCNRYMIPYLPGCMTVTEMIKAMEAGCDIIKLFPANAVGPDYIKTIKGPLPNVNIMPTGGIALERVNAWITSGAVALGIGSDLTAPAKKGDYEGVTKLAKLFVDEVAKARSKK